MSKFKVKMKNETSSDEEESDDEQPIKDYKTDSNTDSNEANDVKSNKIASHNETNNLQNSSHETNMKQRKNNTPLKNSEPSRLSTKKSDIESSINSPNLITSLLETDTFMRLKSFLNKNIFGSVCILTCLILLIYIQTTSSQLNSPANKQKKQIDASMRKERLTKFNSFLQEIKIKYPNQTELFWANIGSSFKHSVMESKDPSIVLIVNDQNTRELANRLIKDLMKGLTTVMKSNVYDLDNFIVDPVIDSNLKKLINLKDSNKCKLYVDNRLDKIFKDGEKMALVKNVEMLPAHAMLIFYTYGDDLYNAKYPGILILMTLDLDFQIEPAQKSQFLQSQSVLTKFVEDHLFNIWSKQIGEDQIRPLFTRIANNVIFLNTE